MPHLKLASTKISPELMDRLKRFTELTGVNQSAAIRQAIEQFLDSDESTGLTELTHDEGSFKTSQLGTRVDAVYDHGFKGSVTVSRDGNLRFAKLSLDRVFCCARCVDFGSWLLRLVLSVPPRWDVSFQTFRQCSTEASVNCFRMPPVPTKSSGL